jgi:hypothetical protein
MCQYPAHCPAVVVTFLNLLFYAGDGGSDRLCGLVIRVPGYVPRGPGFDSRSYQIFLVAVALERGSRSLVRITEKLLE